MKITYIGSFPPPYGGVTVKNALLCEALSEHLDLEVIDLAGVRRLDAASILRLGRAVFGRDGALMVGTAGVWRRRLARFLKKYNKRKMGRSLLFVMGGDIPEDKGYLGDLSYYGKVYVETETMREAFEARGISSAKVYPNCRPRPKNQICVKPTNPSRLRVVYFSLISEEKGAGLVCKAAQLLPDVEFHLYGKLDEGFRGDFFAMSENLPNIEYHGVFDSVAGDVLGELNKYDLHLFPTMCPKEGVPGVIAETKMAGVPTIASSRCYNSELVSDGVDGILTFKDSAEELAGIIGSLSKDPSCVDEMKVAALKSAESFYVENYIDDILSDLREVISR